MFLTRIRGLVAEWGSHQTFVLLGIDHLSYMRLSCSQSDPSLCPGVMRIHFKKLLGWCAPRASYVSPALCGRCQIL